MSPINRVNLPFLYDDSWSPFWGSPKFLQRRIVSWPICTSCLRHSSGQWSLPSCGLVIFTDPITSSYPPSSLPSGKLTWLWKITICIGKTHYKWPFSIAMLNYQRVSTPSFLFFSASAMGIYGMYGQSEAKQNLAHKIDMMVSALQGPEWCCLSLLTGRRPAKGCRHPGKVHVNGNSTGLASKNWIWTEKSTSAETSAMPVFFAWVRGQELVFLAQDAPFKCGFICSGWFHPSIFWSFATTISVLSLALFCFFWWSDNKLGKTDLFRSWLGSRSQDRCFKTVTPWVREDSGGFSPRRGGWIDSFHGKRGTFLRIFSNQR